MDTRLIVEEKADAVGRVILFRAHLFVGKKANVGVRILKEWNEAFCHGAGQLAGVS
jgi:hypothetical protein